MPVVVVLVRTHSPGNLGAAARAAKNFGAELALVEPRADVHHPDAVAYASGAEEILEKKDLQTSWRALREDVSLIVALSSLRGRITRGLPPATTFAAVRRDRCQRARCSTATTRGISSLRTASGRRSSPHSGSSTCRPTARPDRQRA